MSDRQAFGAAVEELSTAFERGTSLCRPFLRMLPVTGAAISTLGPPFGSETVCASDTHAARIDEIQFDLGEGPCWDALTTGRPVLIPDLQGECTRWPLFRDALGGARPGSLFAFPLAIGSLNIGAVDLYSRLPGALTDAQVVGTSALLGICARQVLRRSLADLPNPGTEDRESGQGFSRREVHQATGMVLAQLGVNAADALLIITGHAFARDRTVREVAADIVARRIDLRGEWAGPSDPLSDSL